MTETQTEACGAMVAATDNRLEVEAAARDALGPEIVSFIDEGRGAPQPASRLIAVLHAVQARFGYLSERNLDAVARLMQVPAAKVAGVASFYHFFRLKPQGKYAINVCMGTACYVKGAERVAQKIMDELGVAWGETSKDGLFTLEGSRCLGTCGLAPVVMIGEEVHPNVAPEQVPAMLEKYIRASRGTARA